MDETKVREQVRSKLQDFFEQKKWSKDVKTKKEPPENLFRDKSADAIASWAWNSHDGNLKGAMASLNFYINRGGKNISGAQKSKVEKAKELLQKKSGE